MIDPTPSLKVCFFSHSSHIFGAERSLLELVTQLSRDYAVRCTVVLPGDGPLREKLEAAGASTMIANYFSWCDANLSGAVEIDWALNTSMEAVLHLITEDLAKINPDVIVSNTLAIPWGAVTAAFLKKPHVWHIREFGELDHNLKFFWAFSTILEIVKQSSNLIITNANAVKRALFGAAPGPNVVTVYNSVEIPPHATTSEAGRTFFSRPNATRLIIAAVISKAKGQQDAILAVHELIQRKREVELIVMGHPTPHLKELEKLVKDKHLESNVKFFEFRNNPYPVINQSDIVLLCSRSEAFGRNVIEAMLLKKPVIGTNSGGTPEQVEDGYNGLLYESGDHLQLTDKIEYLIDHVEKMKEFGENGFEFVKKNFTRERYGGSVYEILKNLKDQANPLSSNCSHFLTDRMSALYVNGARRKKDLSLEITRLEAESARLQTEAVELKEQILSMKQTLGWMISDRYGKTMEKSKVLSVLHAIVIVPIKRIARKQPPRSAKREDVI